MVIRIKRPLVGVFIFLLAGILLYLWAELLIMIIVFVVFFLVFLYRILKNRMSYFYLIFPFAIILGFFSAKINDIPALEEYYCETKGEVTKVQKSNYGYKLWIKDEGVIVYSEERFSKGDIISVRGVAKPFSDARNPGGFNSKKYYSGFHIYYMISSDEIILVKKNTNPIYTWADKLSRRLTDSFYSITDEKHGSVFCAMLLGNKDELDEGVYDLFSSSGIGHILAISGLHISIIGMGLYKIIRRTGIPYLPSMIICSGIILFYGIMTGNGVSTIRAIIMFIIAVYANAVGRTYDLISATCLAGFIILLESPMLVFNGGFLLSFGAIGGIGIINPIIIKTLECKKNWIKSLISGISIQLATMPIVMYVYYEIPIYSVLLNLIVVPLMTYVMIFALAGCLAACFHYGIGSFLVGVSVYILDLYEKLCEICMKLPGAIWSCGKPEFWQMLVYYLVLVISLLFLYYKKQKRYLTGFLVAGMVIALRFYNPFEVVFLDVGQGDGIFIRSGTNTIMVDGGSSDEKSLYEFTLKPFLMSEAVKELDYVFITHPDLDHMSGIKALMESNKIKVNNLIVPNVATVDKDYAILMELANKNGTTIIKIAAGQVFSDGTTIIKCISPTEGETDTNKNDYSIVLLVEYNDYKILLTGDISSKVEKTILPYIDEVDILKVAHHGSKDSNSMDFLQKSGPDIAVISSGKNNSYGHPHKETMDKLRRIKAEILCTADKGAVIFSRN